MRGVNRVTLIGHLGDDPDVRFMPDGKAVANLRVATGKSWTDKESGERKESTEWHRVVLFGRRAEVARDFLKKGAAVYIEGELKTRKWPDKESGADRYTTEVIGNDMQMLDRKASAGRSAEPAEA